MSGNQPRTAALAASAAFWAWCALVSYPMINESHDLAELARSFTTSRLSAICQAIGLALFLTAIGAFYFARLSSALANLNLAQLGILFIICLSLALQLHGDEAATLVGIFYTCLILITALSLSVLWTLPVDEFERCMRVASITLALFGIAAIAILGWPQGRNVGSIQPNLFASPLLAGFIFSLFYPGSVAVAVRVLCFAMIALVSSRYALIGCVTAFVLYEMTFNPLSLWKIPLVIIVVAATILFSPQIVSILALDDTTRDLSSGFAGRNQYWYSALDAINQNPLGIGFKRAAGDEAGHNGYLKTLLEFGVAGGGMIILFLACNIIIAGLDAVRHRGVTLPQRRHACARFGGLAALSFGAFFQPQLLALGDAFAMSLLLLLFRPTIATSNRSLAVDIVRRPAPAA